MAIVKSKHASNFTVVPNEVFEQKLSIGAIGLLAYLLSLPSNWVIYKMTLHEQFDEGRDKIHGFFKELQDKGYIVSEQKSTGKGKIEYKHIVYDKPLKNENLPSTGFPLTEKPSTDPPLTETPLTEKHPLLNKHNTKETITKETVDLAEEVVGILNKYCGTHFKANNKKTQSLISAREKEGYGVADFEIVVKFQVNDWKGDLKMSKFLRPETLFGNKFEGYLQVAMASQPKKIESNIPKDENKW